MISTSTTDTWSAPYTGIAQLSSSYSKKLEENLFKESPIIAALKREQQKAVDAIAADLERELFGSKTMKRNEGLRQLIADAYDERMPKEAEMSAVDEVMKEREEARARELFEAVDGIFTNAEYGVGHLTSWTVVFEVGGKEYHYAAVLAGDGCWYVTGKDTTGRKTEAFKGYLVELAMRAHTFELEGEAL